MTPMQAYTGVRPNLNKLRVFGSLVVARLPGKRIAKLDPNTASGVFLGYTATDSNIYYQDYTTKKIKVATHVSFDEAGYANHPMKLTLLQQQLQTNEPCSMANPDIKVYDIVIHTDPTGVPLLGQAESNTLVTGTNCCLQVHKLSDRATIPTTAEAAGYDLYSAVDIEIMPHTVTKIPTNIAVRPPQGTYCQIWSRSGLVTKHGIAVQAGTIDRDYTGDVTVILYNHSSAPYMVQEGHKIAQLVIHKIAQPPICETSNLPEMDRGNNGFGSTDLDQAVVNAVHDDTVPLTGVDSPTATLDDILKTIMEEDNVKPYNIWFSLDPYHKRVSIVIPVKGDHPTLGLLVRPTEQNHRVQLYDIEKSTPASKLPWWRNMLKRGIILSINKQPVTNPSDLVQLVEQACQQKLLHVHCEIATVQYQPLHPIKGSLMLYNDQMNVVAKHLTTANNANDTDPNTHQHMPQITQVNDISKDDLGKTFTLKQLKKRYDWPQWQQARYKMLDNYQDQGMFGDPMEAPKGANIHHMLWRYMVKMCGTRKARMVCDGAPRQGTITLGYTFANSVDAGSERLFWAIAAQKGLKVFGADCSNAFAEAPPPQHPLYMWIDEAYKEWWYHHLKRDPIPPHHTVVRVQNAIQGHPESPRLWEKMIDGILRRNKLHPMTHEPCLYMGYINGGYTLFLRQVDDVAIAMEDDDTATILISNINVDLKLPIQIMGPITQFNGMDIQQSRYYIKITCTKYINKMVQSHPWSTLHPLPTMPLPFPSDKESLRKLLQCNLPQTETEQKQLEERMGIKYRHVMGEVLFPMVKCRPDISVHTIILSQYMNNPGQPHYEALKNLDRYLAHTVDEGIYYWRSSPVLALPTGTVPTLHHDNYTLTETRGTNSLSLVRLVDSDWATHSTKCTSITGMVLMYVGGAVGYKSKFQPVIAHSSTEAEFVAACDMAKMILFYRSLLQQVGIEQTDATILFEDNNGAMMTANTQQPTRRTRHMELKYFALLDWVERDLLVLEAIKTHDNAADAMTKTLTTQLFYRHYDTYMGLRIPDYAKQHIGPLHSHS
jgi:deoxyuridine 5'-triphosphate nucleotidohydrolase